MKEGMLWFDDDIEFTLLERICMGCEYYEEKYGHAPDTVIIHPDTMEEGFAMQSVNLQTSPMVGREFYYWIGVDDE